MIRIYIAGPYSGKDITTILGNIRRGIRKAAELVQMGYPVFCPFLDFLMALVLQPGEEISKEQYQANSIAWVECCDLMIVLPGWEESGGTKREIARAKELGIRVAYEPMEEAEA